MNDKFREVWTEFDPNVSLLFIIIFFRRLLLSNYLS